MRLVELFLGIVIAPCAAILVLRKRLTHESPEGRNSDPGLWVSQENIAAVRLQILQKFAKSGGIEKAQL